MTDEWSVRGRKLWWSLAVWLVLTLAVAGLVTWSGQRDERVRQETHRRQVREIAELQRRKMETALRGTWLIGAAIPQPELDHRTVPGARYVFGSPQERGDIVLWYDADTPNTAEPDKRWRLFLDPPNRMRFYDMDLNPRTLWTVTYSTGTTTSVDHGICDVLNWQLTSTAQRGGMQILYEVRE